jgi:predicted flap endonuclease-1-like 5' DNA nuclease
MTAPARMLRQIWPRRVHAAGGRPRPAESGRRIRSDHIFPDDLTAIRGIGMASQNRLYKAGIKTYADLAGAAPTQVRMMLGSLAHDAIVEEWITQARQLAEQD